MLVDLESGIKKTAKCMPQIKEYLGVTAVKEYFFTPFLDSWLLIPDSGSFFTIQL
jgi:hypothetical protein